MTEVKVLVPFHDKDKFSIVYMVGEQKAFDNDRAAALAARGLVEIIAPEPVEAPLEEDKPKRGRGRKKESVADIVEAPTETIFADEVAEAVTEVADDEE